MLVGVVDAPLPMTDCKYITLSAVDGLTEGLKVRGLYLVGGNSDEASFTRRGLNANARLNAITDKENFLAMFDSEQNERCRLYDCTTHCGCI
jgi:hypothetical protein